MTAEEVLGDLDGERFEVERAERVTREVVQPDGTTRTAYDALVRVVRQASLSGCQSRNSSMAGPSPGPSARVAGRRCPGRRCSALAPGRELQPGRPSGGQSASQ